MGYAWNGVCFQTTDAALSAFAEQVPSADTQGINAFTVAPTISGSGLISWSISNRPLSADLATVRTGTVQLLPCNTEGMSQWSAQSLLLVCALFFAWAHGFKGGYRA